MGQLLKLPSFNLEVRGLGPLQTSGPLAVLPVFGVQRDAAFAPPLSGLKLEGVRGYGNVELHNLSPGGVAVVPLHMGYIQDRAQNHALCRSAFLGAGQKLLFEDACCVQQSQGGYLESKEQWFFVLPLALREEALQLRGQKNYGKLWPAIARLNRRFGMEDRGHLEQVLCRRRPLLTQYQSRFELQPAQTGALFFLADRLVGVEIAPSAAYFQEVWMPLICFCYGAAALELEGAAAPAVPAQPFVANSLVELRLRLEESRRLRQERIRRLLDKAPAGPFDRHEEERFLNLRLYTAAGENFLGQCVEEDGQVVYASLFARARHIPGVAANPGPGAGVRVG
jgi:hypothetical protein